MKHYYVLWMLAMISTIGYSQISVDETPTAQELIEDIFINNDCVVVSNVSQSTGIDFGDVNGIAAFAQNGSDFPYANGIVLTTGNVASAPGPNTTLLSDGETFWPGDADLEAVTGVANTLNASYIQFDFIPFVNEVNLNFIMASEEYNQFFECSFADAFAFILTDNVTGEVTNLAVLPGTDIPIQTNNVHPDVPGFCDAINEEYFDKYNILPFNPPEDAAINYNGQMVSLTGNATVVENNSYTIKIVIADFTDEIFDAAVFLEASSFTYAVNLGEDRTTATGNPGCEGSELELGIQPASATTYQWLADYNGNGVFDVIPNETQSTIFVNQSARYRLEVNNSSCLLSGEVEVEFVPGAEAGQPSDIFIDEGDGDGTAEFDLTINESQVLGAQAPGDFTVSYYETLEDAQNATNAIANPTAYANIENPQIIYVRLERLANGCFDTTQFEIETDGLGIEDHLASSIRMLPNPVSEVLTIASEFTISEINISIYTLNGIKVFAENTDLTSEGTTIDVSGLPQGFYFVTITSKDFSVTKKIVRK